MLEQLEPRVLMSASLLGHDLDHDNEPHVLPLFDSAIVIEDNDTSSPVAGTLSETFSLHSNPGAKHTIYLDFDGHTTEGTAWNSWKSITTINTPAYDIDDDPLTFNNTELSRIQNIFLRVAEDFIPFDVNVTTEEPPLDHLKKNGSSDTHWGVRVVIGGSSSDWLGQSAGGIAYVNSFNWTSDTPTFVFENQLGNGSEKLIAEATSHEVGHTLGLNHDGKSSQAYYSGHGSGETSWAPIMGVGYSRTLTQWSKGEYSGATNSQDDLDVITTRNGFGYRADDHGGNLSSASNLTVSGINLTGSGIIERNTDFDVFEFSTSGGAVTFDIQPSQQGPNLDVLAELLDSNGNVIATSNPENLISASINETVAAGTYYLRITGTGKGDPLNGGYSDYASLGQYTIAGQIDAGIVQTVNVTIDDVVVDESSGTATFKVTLSGAASESVSVLVSTADGTAVSGSDYESLSKTLTFSPGQTQKWVTVTVLNDGVQEPSETFTLELSDLTGPAELGDGVGEATIEDDDAVVVSVGDVSVDESSGTATFKVTLSGAASESVSVLVSTADGTAVSGSDYESLSKTVTFSPGQTQKWVTVTVLNDGVQEPSETFTLELSDLTGPAELGDGVGEATIEDDDAVVVSVGDVSVDESSGTATFKVTLSGAASESVSVLVSTADGTAVSGSDYESLSKTLTFSPGQTQKWVTVTVLNDGVQEPSETFTLELSDLTGPAELGDGVGEATIEDDDAVVVSVGDVSVDESSGTATFKVTLSGAASESVSVLVTTADGTAVSGSDYESLSKTLTFSPGQTQKWVTVTVLNDGVQEPSETFTLELSDLTGPAELGDGLGEATIEDDDAVVVSVGDVSVDESSGTATFKVTLSGAASESVSVLVSTADGTAVSGSDYESLSKTLTFSPGQTQKWVTVTVLNDGVQEPSETFTLELSDLTGPAELGDGVGEATIEDDDAVVVSVGDVSVDESSGTATFKVTLSGAASESVSVLVSTADGTAVSGSDYESLSKTVTFSPGQTQKWVTVTVLNDGVQEPSETFTLELSDLTGPAELGDGLGEATIEDDDAVVVSVGDVSVDESSGTATFKVTLSGAASESVSVLVSTADGTAVSGSDYESLSKTLTFSPGQTQKWVTVTVLNDGVQEPSETFTLELSDLTGPAELGDGVGEATIEDDDAVVVSVGDVSVDESSGTATFKVTLSGAASESVSVLVSTADGTAVSGSDYESLSKTVTFSPGQTQKWVTVTVLNDGVQEPSETFTLELSDLTGPAELGDGVGEATIEDDDAVVVSVGDVSVDESSGTATFKVTLSGAASESVSVLVSTADGTAVSGSDYESLSKTLTFSPGQTQKWVTVTVLNDGVQEPSETFTLELSDLTGPAELGDGVGEATIEDDDAVVVSVGDVSVDESSGTATFKVTLSGAASESVSVLVSTADGTAVSGSDYESLSKTLTFSPGQTQKWVTVTVLNDGVQEPSETFTLELSDLTGPAELGDGVGEATIEDDDAVVVSVGDVSVDESSGTATFKVTLSGAASESVSVLVTTADGTAVSGSDYESLSKTLTFSPGQTQKWVTVTVLNDGVQEPSETFTLELSDLTGPAELGDGLGEATIEDDDAVVVSVGDVSVDESSGTATFKVTLSGAASESVSVLVSTADGTAVSGSDYESLSKTVTFSPGQTQKWVTVTVLNDGVQEPSETFTLELSDLTGPAELGDGVGEATIEDDDAVVVSVSDAEITEGTPSEGKLRTVIADSMTFTINLSGPSSEAVTVTYTTVDGTARDTKDFVQAQGTVTFEPGETSKTVDVGVVADFWVEKDEVFTLQLVGATNATIQDDQGVGTIINDDLKGSARKLRQSRYSRFRTGAAMALKDLEIGQLLSSSATSSSGTTPSFSSSGFKLREIIASTDGDDSRGLKVG